MNIQIYRTNASSYQSPTFFKQEKAKLEKIEGVKYISSLNEINKDDPFILITNTHTDTEMIPQVLLEKTLLIIHPNSGHDNFPIDFIQNSDFPVILGNPIRSHAVVEYNLGCIFNHFTKIENHLHWSESRTWNRKLLRDQKVLIMGNGHIGKVLYSSLTHLCKEVKIYDPYIENNFSNPNHISEFSTDMFKDIQILICAQSLNDKNTKQIDLSCFKQLSSDCLIINSARGKLCNEDDLIHFLQKNPKAFAYLDVFEKEPFSPGYLHDLKNINKTSHIAGVYEKLNSDIIAFEYHIIKEFLTYMNADNKEQFNIDYKDFLLSEKIDNNHLI